MNVISYIQSLLEVRVLVKAAKFLQYVVTAISILQFDGAEYPRQAAVNDGQSFDFIVVGAGSAGCVVANRLSEVHQWSVLLIEAGDNPPIGSKVPGLFATVDYSSADWNYYTVNDGYSSQAHKKKSIHLTRGKMLGGSSGANYMYYVKGNRADFDYWAALGNDGWSWDEVTHYFKKSERLNDVSILRSDSASQHGLDGYLGITKPVWKSNKKYLEAFRQNGHEILVDVNGYRQLGYSIPQFTIDDSIRQSTAAAFLSPITERGNLFVLKNSIGRKVIFDQTLRAVGVEVRLPNKRIVKLMARREVILSAGAINSPQILMVSGIGPKEHLESLAINVLLDSPNVGANLMDHPIVPVMLAGSEDFASVIENLSLITNLDKFPTPSLIGHVALDKAQTYPDYQTTVFPVPILSPIPALVCGFVLGLDDEICTSMESETKSRQLILAILSLLHPKSRGRIRLKSKNPEAKPLIYSGYYKDTRDLEKHARCMEDYVSVINTTYFRSVGGYVVNMRIPQCRSLVFGSHEYWKCHVLNVASTQWHPAGTCAMGVQGVVDDRLRVRGVTGLRVADASVTPSTISANINAAVIMIGEKVSDMIKYDHSINDFT